MRNVQTLKGILQLFFSPFQFFSYLDRLMSRRTTTNNGERERKMNMKNYKCQFICCIKIFSHCILFRFELCCMTLGEITLLMSCKCEESDLKNYFFLKNWANWENLSNFQTKSNIINHNHSIFLTITQFPSLCHAPPTHSFDSFMYSCHVCNTYYG